MRGYNSSAFLSNNLWVALSDGASEDVDESDMSEGEDPEVDIGNASSNMQTNTKREAEQEERKNSLQRTRDGIFTRNPIFDISSFLKHVYSWFSIYAPRKSSAFPSTRASRSNARKRGS